jgi:hypothetical protein
LNNPELQRLVNDYRAFANLARQAERWGLPMAAATFRQRARETAARLIRLHQQQQPPPPVDGVFLPFPVVPWPPTPPAA